MSVISSTAWNGVSPAPETTPEAGTFPVRSAVWGISYARRGAAASLLQLGLNGWGLLRQWLATERD